MPPILTLNHGTNDHSSTGKSRPGAVSNPKVLDRCQIANNTAWGGGNTKRRTCLEEIRLVIRWLGISMETYIYRYILSQTSQNVHTSSKRCQKKSIYSNALIQAEFHHNSPLLDFVPFNSKASIDNCFPSGNPSSHIISCVSLTSLRLRMDIPR